MDPRDISAKAGVSGDAPSGGGGVGTVDWRVFGLREAPFSMTPDPSYLYLGAAHEGALANLVYGIGERKGFLMVTGEVGTGKTTLCRALMSQLDRGVHKALILSSNLGRDELIRLIASDLGMGEERGGRVEDLENINRFLLERLARGENAVIIIDEAQNLPDSTLEELRLISNLETDREKLIQIVLVGQPELREKLKKPNLRQLDQRITVRYHLRPLTVAETGEYVAHRVAVASIGERPALFGPAALRAVHAWSGGYPRLINILCDRALGLAHREGRKKVDAGHLKSVRKEVEGEVPRRPSVLHRWAVPAAGLLILLWLLSGRSGPPSPPLLPAGAPAADAVPVKDGHGIVRTDDPGGTLNASIATLFGLWGLDYLAGESRQWRIVNLNSRLLQVFFDEMDIAGQYGVEFHARGPDESGIRTLGLPCLVAFPAGEGEESSRYAVLAALRGEKAVLYDPLEGRREISLDTLLPMLDGPVHYLLRGIGASSDLRAGDRGSPVMAVQEQLQGRGFYAAAPDGRYGPLTEESVRALQRSYGLEESGIVDIESRLILGRLSGNSVPTLDNPEL